jgi:hypothetical protein
MALAKKSVTRRTRVGTNRRMVMIIAFGQMQPEANRHKPA